MPADRPETTIDAAVRAAAVAHSGVADYAPDVEDMNRAFWAVEAFVAALPNGCNRDGIVLMLSEAGRGR